ncbi:unnamed protein product [Schistocephalus solidus]|uniref:Uncharacterized protein n=1 Tax=Schistocephalus solidus TaxID=70667 RepID=A0A183T345_SCHSO|nr:unnamed protein product [Schistocephalus solidus]
MVSLDSVSVEEVPSSAAGFDPVSDGGSTATTTTITTTDAVVSNSGISSSTGAEPARFDPPGVSPPRYDSTVTAAAAAAAAMATFDYLAGMLSGASQSLYDQISPQAAQDAPRGNSTLPFDAMNAFLTATDPSSNTMNALTASTLLCDSWSAEFLDLSTPGDLTEPRYHEHLPN